MSAVERVREGSGVRLLMCRCQRCGRGWFPTREVCPACLSLDLTNVETEDEGTVYSSTHVHTGAPGFGESYMLAYVDVSGVRILMRVEASAALEPSTRVRFTDHWSTGEHSGSYGARPIEGR